MQIRKGKPPGSGRLAGIGVELSRGARVRLAWMDFYGGCGNVAHTGRHFGISRQTFYRWQRRYDQYDLTSLEERSHRPRQCRQPTWPFSFEEKVLGLRLQFPRWGKDKLAVLLRRQKVAISVSMVGRILRRLKQQGRLVEPPRSGVPGSRRALRPRPYAVRKPREYAASQPGDLVEVDTLDVRPLPGVIFKQFTARDVGFPLGRAASAHPRHRSNRYPVPRHFAAPYAVFYPRRPGRWRLGAFHRRAPSSPILGNGSSIPPRFPSISISPSSSC